MSLTPSFRQARMIREDVQVDLNPSIRKSWRVRDRANGGIHASHAADHLREGLRRRDARN
jgi:hypothetical protein